MRLRARPAPATVSVNSISNRHDTTFACSSDCGKLDRPVSDTYLASRPISVSARSVGTFHLRTGSGCRTRSETPDAPFDLRVASPWCEGTISGVPTSFDARKKSHSVLWGQMADVADQASEAGADFLRHSHWRVGERHQPQQGEACLCAGLRLAAVRSGRHRKRR